MRDDFVLHNKTVTLGLMGPPIPAITELELVMFFKRKLLVRQNFSHMELMIAKISLLSPLANWRTVRAVPVYIYVCVCVCVRVCVSGRECIGLLHES